MRESKVEKALRIALESMGGRCDKFIVPGRRNVPDRLCTIPFTPMFLVETKTTGLEPNDGQWREIYRFRSRGVFVFVVDREEQIPEVIGIATNSKPRYRAYHEWVLRERF